MVKTEPMQLSHESKKRLKDRDRTVGRKREVGSPNERNQAFKCTQVSKSLLWMASTEATCIQTCDPRGPTFVLVLFPKVGRLGSHRPLFL